LAFLNLQFIIPHPMQKIAITLLTLIAASSLLAQNAEPTSADGLLGRIVFIGDSISAGVGVSNRGASRYSTVTTRLLKQKHPDAHEINLAQSGRALCQQRSSYARDVLKHNPDALEIQWGVNDQYWGYSLAQFVARYDQLVQTVRAAKPGMPIVLTTLVADFRWPENMDLWIGEANIAIQEIAARYLCRVAFVHRALDHDQAFYADTIHPNDAGAELMAKAIVAALEAPPMSSENLSVQFDQGREVRFMRYVFILERDGIEPQWIRVANLSKNGMSVETPIPISVRTPASYSTGHTYRVTICESDGKEIQSFEQEVIWNRMLQFTIDPKDSQSPLDISIVPVKDGRP
jgi:lysophospholipase L1-like esterase